MLNLNNKYNILLSNNKEDNMSLKDILSAYPKTILYFYPKDNTPWCSLENQDFSSLKKDFLDKQINVIWVSKDTVESHKKFVVDKKLGIDLISDSDLSLHKELWVYWEKNNYWKIVLWVIRSTFLVDKDWNIIKEWRNIKATWHAARVLNEL